MQGFSGRCVEFSHSVFLGTWFALHTLELLSHGFDKAIMTARLKME